MCHVGPILNEYSWVMPVHLCATYDACGFKTRSCTKQYKNTQMTYGDYYMPNLASQISQKAVRQAHKSQ